MKKQITLLIALLYASCLPSFGQLDETDNLPQSAPVVIYGEIKTYFSVEEVKLELMENYIGTKLIWPEPLILIDTLRPGNMMASSMGMQVFGFTTPPISKPTYVNLVLGRYKLLDMYLLMPGDKVRIQFDLLKGATVFSGESADNFKTQYQIKLSEQEFAFSQPQKLNVTDSKTTLSSEESASFYSQAIADSVKLVIPVSLVERGKGQIDNFISRMDLLVDLKSGLEALESARSTIPNELYEHLKADIYGKAFGSRFSSLNISDKNVRQEFDPQIQQAISKMEIPDFSSSTKVNSAFFKHYLFEKTFIEGNSSEGEIYRILNEKYSGELKEHLLSKFIALHFKRLTKREQYVENALETFRNPIILQKLDQLRQSQFAGSPFYHFTLETRDGREVTLDDLKGKIVLVDFWYTGCKACIKYYENSLKAVEHHFKDEKDFVLMSISKDKEKETWVKSIDGGRYTSSSALNLYAGGNENPIIQYYQIQGYPYQMLLDREGKVLQAGGLNESSSKLIKILEKHLKSE